MATVARVFAGGFLSFIGLFHLNDLKGFSQQLTFFFQDDVVAYQIKNAWGWYSFSVEGLIPFAPTIALLLALAQLCFGLFLVINAKMRLTSNGALIVSFFIGFFTLHAAFFSPSVSYTNVDSYVLNAPIGQGKLKASKTNKHVVVVSRTNNKLVISEKKNTPHELDARIENEPFGKYLQHSISIQAWEYVILVYLLVWVVAAQRWMYPNSVRQNWVILPIFYAAIFCCSWWLNWYFLSLFIILITTLSLWIYRSGGKHFGNHYSSLVLILIPGLSVVNYTNKNQPIKDFSVFTFGENWNEKVLFNKNGQRIGVLLNKQELFQPKMQRAAISRELLNSKLLTAEWDKSVKHGNPSFSLLTYILNAPKSFLFCIPKPEDCSAADWMKMRRFLLKAKKNKIEPVFIFGYSSKTSFNLRDILQLNALESQMNRSFLQRNCNSNCCLIELKKGIIVDKYSLQQLPF